MSLIQLSNFALKGDSRGHLVALEAMKDVPFEIKRIYYLSKLKTDYPRGFHAHKALKQLAVCIQGSCRFIMDDGISKEETWLDSPTQGLLIDKMIWHEMHDFSQDCLLVVLANDVYDEADYIRNYDEFIEACNYA